MNPPLKVILTRGYTELLNGLRDLVISNEFADDCASKKDSYIHMVFNAVSSELVISLDSSNSPTMDETKDIMVLVDDEVVAQEKDHTSEYLASIPIDSFSQVIDKTIIVAVNGSDKLKGCIFTYHLVFNPYTDLLLTSDDSRVYSVQLIQNDESEIQIAIDTSNTLFMLNGEPYPTGTALTNAKSRQLVSDTVGIVTADINGFIVTSLPYSIDQSPCVVTIEQGESNRDDGAYIDFIVTVETDTPHSTYYYIDDNIYNSNSIKYDESLVGKVVTVVLRPVDQSVLTNLNNVLDNIENYCAFDRFTIEHRSYVML